LFLKNKSIRKEWSSKILIEEEILSESDDKVSNKSGDK